VSVSLRARVRHTPCNHTSADQLRPWSDAPSPWPVRSLKTRDAVLFTRRSAHVVDFQIFSLTSPLLRLARRWSGTGDGPARAPPPWPWNRTNWMARQHAHFRTMPATRSANTRNTHTNVLTCRRLPRRRLAHIAFRRLALGPTFGTPHPRPARCCAVPRCQHSRSHAAFVGPRHSRKSHSYVQAATHASEGPVIVACPRLPAGDRSWKSPCVWWATTPGRRRK
jgi:hypothetical protein